MDKGTLGTQAFGSIPRHSCWSQKRLSHRPRGIFTITHIHSCKPHHLSQTLSLHQRKKYKEEERLGRISRGYTKKELEDTIGYFRTAPLSVAESRPGKLRAITNHSYPFTRYPIDLKTLPRNSNNKIIINPSVTSINSVIDTTQFQCEWGTFYECLLIVAEAPPLTQAAIFDVDAAFRNIPTHPSVRRFTAVMVGELIHLDNCLNFGAAPSPGIWGRVADAMAAILRKKGVNRLVKWVDDFVFFRSVDCSLGSDKVENVILFRYPTRTSSNSSVSYSYDEGLVWDTAETLGWPWAPSKFVPFASSFMYIGFSWDLVVKTVQLPEPKKTKYRAKLDAWQKGEKRSRAEAESLIGTLNHVCLVVPWGRPYLVNLYKFRGSFKDNQSSLTRHTIAAALSNDILWWSSLLEKDFVGMNIIKPPQISPDISIFVDASTSWGIGIILNNKWLAFEFKDGWKSDGREIGWAEMVAIDLALRTLRASKYSNVHVRIHSDNMGVVGALQAGSSRGSKQNEVLKEIVSFMMNNDLWITTEWVSTSANPADGPSRGVFPDRKLLHAYPPAIPSYLKTFIHIPINSRDSRLQ